MAAAAAADYGPRTPARGALHRWAQLWTLINYGWVNDGGWVYDFDKGDWGHWHADSDEIHLWEGTFDFPFEVGVTLFHEAAHRLGMNEEQAEAAALNCVL